MGDSGGTPKVQDVTSGALRIILAILAGSFTYLYYHMHENRIYANYSSSLLCVSSQIYVVSFLLLAFLVGDGGLRFKKSVSSD